MIPLKVCRAIWNQIYHPKSAVPDVEIGRVFDIMVDFLAEEQDPQLPLVERWVLAATALAGKSSSYDLTSSWADKVPYYTDQRGDHGAPIPRPYEEYDADQAAKRKEMEEAIQSLVEKGLITPTVITGWCLWKDSFPPFRLLPS